MRSLTNEELLQRLALLDGIGDHDAVREAIERLRDGRAVLVDVGKRTDYDDGYDDGHREGLEEERDITCPHCDRDFTG